MPALPQYIVKCLCILGRNDDAVIFCEKHLEKDEKDADFWHALGDARVAMQLNQEAIIAYQQAVSLSSDYKRDLIETVVCMLKNVGREADARLWLHNLESSEPDKLMREIGIAYFRLEDSKEALKRVEQAVKDYPDDSRLCEIHGYCLYILQNYEDARVSFEKCIGLDPMNVKVLEFLGHSCVVIDDAIHAVEYYRKAFAINHDTRDIYGYLAQALADSGEYSEALDLLDKAPATEKNDGFINSFRGYVYKKMGDYERAIAAYKITLSSDSEDKDLCIEPLAECYIHIGDQKSADELLATLNAK